MDEAIRTAAMSPLRERLIDDMNMRRFSRENVCQGPDGVRHIRRCLFRQCSEPLARPSARLPSEIQQYNSVAIGVAQPCRSQNPSAASLGTVTMVAIGDR